MVPFNNDEDGMLSNIHPLVHIRPPRTPSMILMILLWFLLLPFSMVLKKVSRSIDETHVLISSQIPTAFTFITLEKSIRASNDTDFQRIQAISRIHPSNYVSDPSILEEFEDLLKTTCTFVTDWSDPVITNNTFRLYAKTFPAK